MSKINALYLDGRIKNIEKKINGLNAGIEKRRAESKAKFPNVNVLEMETIDDSITLAELYGQHKAYKSLRRMV